MAALTPKQARFVAEYLIDLNATQAAIRAGYSARTAAQGAAQLLSNIKVRSAVDAGIAKRSDKLEITAEKVLRDLEEQRLAAKQDRQHGAAIRASELQGKHVGMFGERVTITDERMVVRAPEQSADAAEWAGKHGPH